jgi:hypothetical protein
MKCNSFVIIQKDDSFLLSLIYKVGYDFCTRANKILYKKN